MTTPPAILKNDDHRALKLLAYGPFLRRPGGWRFGTKCIADHVVDRLIASGRASREGDQVSLVARLSK
jgi:hypothetical protein